MNFKWSCCVVFFSFFPSCAQVDSDTSGSALDLIPPFITRSWVTGHLAASLWSSSCTKDSSTNSEMWLVVRPQFCLKDPLKRAEDFSFFAWFSRYLFHSSYSHVSPKSVCDVTTAEEFAAADESEVNSHVICSICSVFFPPRWSKLSQTRVKKKLKLLICDLTAWAGTASCQKTRQGLIALLTAKLPEYYPNIRRTLMRLLCENNLKTEQTYRDVKLQNCPNSFTFDLRCQKLSLLVSPVVVQMISWPSRC